MRRHVVDVFLTFPHGVVIVCFGEDPPLQVDHAGSGNIRVDRGPDHLTGMGAGVVEPQVLTVGHDHVPDGIGEVHLEAAAAFLVPRATTGPASLENRDFDGLHELGSHRRHALVHAPSLGEDRPHIRLGGVLRHCSAGRDGENG